MTKPWLFFSSIIVLVSAMLLLPSVRWQLVGRIKGESFYLGRPTSYWLEEIKKSRNPPLVVRGGPGIICRMGPLIPPPPPPPPWWEEWRDGLRKLFPPAPSFVCFFDTDPAALPVLQKLAGDPDPDVSDRAKWFLEFRKVALEFGY
jgi:hypothetical protein